MPSESSLITLRIPAEDHDLLRAVANYSGQTLSAFVRLSAMASARQVIAEVGVDAVLEGDRTHEAQRQTAAQRKLQERLDRLREAASRRDG